MGELEEDEPSETLEEARERLERFLDDLGLFTFDSDDQWVDSSNIEHVHRILSIEDGEVTAGSAFAIGAETAEEEQSWQEVLEAFQAEASELQEPTSLDIEVNDMDSPTAWVGCYRTFPLVGWDEATILETFGAAHAIGNVLAARAEALKLAFSRG